MTDNKQTLCDKFSDFFNDKIDKLRQKITITSTDHRKKIERIAKLKEEKITLTPDIVAKILKSLPNKNCSGIDTIPMCVLKHGAPQLTTIMTRLFNMIFREEKIPDIWRLAKIKPLHKKGDKKKIGNYNSSLSGCDRFKFGRYRTA